MEQLLPYLLKSASLLAIFYLVYQLLLRNDTGFQVNRRFLFWGVIASLILPAVEFTRYIIVEHTPIPLDLAGAGVMPEISPVAEAPLDWWMIFRAIYFLGLGLLLLRFLVQLFSLLRLLNKGSRSREGGYVIIDSEQVPAPFSFFRYILVNSRLHSEEDLRIIIRHEMVHASQWHSADVLLVNLCTVVLWFNPFSWWYKKSLIQNLEYIADKETIAADVPLKQYQHTLLKISVIDLQPALANNFYQSLIKKRILMLNKKPSEKYSFLKTGMVIPLILAFLFFFNVKTEAQVKQDISVSLKISTIINKNSTEKDLSEVVELFKDQGVTLKFDNLEYTAAGLLSNIAISFVRANGQTGNVSFTKPEGLGDILIALDDNGLTIDTVARSEAPDAFLLKVGEQPLYIINNKEYSTAELAGKTLWVREGLSSFSGEEAAKKYSGKAKDGVIVIEKAEILDDFKAALRNVDNKDKKAVNHYISVLEGEIPRLITLEKDVTEYITPPSEHINASQDRQVSAEIFLQDSLKPLFIVDGKIRENFDQESFAPEDIKKIEVLKDTESTKKYGEKGKNGVVLITLKTAAEKQAEEGEDKEFQFEARKITISEDPEKEGSSVKFTGGSKFDFKSAESLLYVVDGKVMGKDFEPEAIDPETIESITVLKGEQATEKYGKKAAKGAVEIEIK